MHKKFISLLLVAFLLVGVLAACGQKTPAENNEPTDTNTEQETEKPADTEDNESAERPTEQGDYSNEPALVLGADDFNGVFSPFFATTGYDMDIVEMVHASLIGFDRNSQPDNSGLAEYIEPEEVKGEDGTIEKTIYTFKLKEGLVFSDGTPITADDVIFTYYVLCDPNYTGSSTIYTTPILGVNEYRYDDVDYADKVAKIKEEADNYEPTEEEIEKKAEQLAEAYGMDKADFMPDGPYYEDYNLAGIRQDKYNADITAYIQSNLEKSEGHVEEIEGIKKIDDRTVQVTIAGVDPKAIYNLGAIRVAPKHYYGEGFKKGDLSMVEAKSGEPMGAGPYRFHSFENNVVTLVANDFFYKGAPHVKKIKYQVTNTANKLEGVKLGEFDISDPSASMETLAQVEAEEDIHYELIDNLGYGYIGINAERITDKNVRKGIFHLMDRKPAVEAYYGNLASVIERPMSRVSWAYPKDATEVYGFDPDKAMEYFEAAGYKLEDGKLMKDGKQLTIEIGIPADGKGDHPSYPIVLGVKNEGEKLGMAVNIVDYADGNKFFDDLDAGKLDIWCAAWQATPDPDMYQTYHSQGPSNHYKLKDSELDQLIIDARSTNDMEARKEMYAKALDIVMDWAVEMPVYQRKNMYIFNKKVIDIDTLPKDMTPYYGYFAEIENLKLTEAAK